MNKVCIDLDNDHKGRCQGDVRPMYYEFLGGTFNFVCEEHEEPTDIIYYSIEKWEVDRMKAKLEEGDR